MRNEKKFIISQSQFSTLKILLSCNNFVECFPKTIAAQSLSATPATEVQKIQVTFSYRYWKNLTDEADLPKPLLDRIEEVVVNSAERQIRAAIPRVLSRL